MKPIGCGRCSAARPTTSGPITAPAVAELADRVAAPRTASRRRSLLALVAAVALVIAATAIALSVRGSGTPRRAAVPERSGAPQRSAALPELPPYQGPRVTAAELATYRWRTLPPAPISARTDATSVWTGRDVLIWGGMQGNTLFADGALYDPAARTWQKLPPSPLSPRIGALATSVDGMVIIWGGENNRQLVDGASYDLRTGTWHLLPAPPDDQRAPFGQPGGGAQLVTVGQRALLIRGPQNQTGRTLQVAAYDPARDTWQALPSFTAPTDHYVQQVQALAVGSVAFVWTPWAHTVPDGPNGTATSSGIDAEALNTATGGWRAVPVRPDQDAGQPQWTGHDILLPQAGHWCGYCAGPVPLYARAVLIDPATGQRTTTPPDRASAYGAATFWTGAAVLAVNMGTEVGGPNGPHLGDTAAWDPATGRWLTLPRAPTGSPGWQGVSIWTGTRLIVWGGTGLEFAPSS